MKNKNIHVNLNYHFINDCFINQICRMIIPKSYYQLESIRLLIVFKIQSEDTDVDTVIYNIYTKYCSRLVFY